MIDPRCGICGIKYGEKLCQKEDGNAPAFCPTRNLTETIERATATYDDDPEIREFARQSAVQEAECYIGRDRVPHVLHPVKTRLEETVEFADRMGYRKLGLAFCAGLAREAVVLQTILERQGFEVVSAICKVGRVPKERIGVREEEKVRIGAAEAMCNPITQAAIMNAAETQFNLVMGLCVGHDSLFLKHAEAMSTVFAVKDRVLGHNPMAAIYTAPSYYQRYTSRSILESE